MHCNLRPLDVAPVVLGCFSQICMAHAHKLLFSSFRSGSESDIPTTFSDPDDFLRAIIWPSNDVFTLWWHWPLTLALSRLQYTGCHVITLCSRWVQKSIILPLSYWWFTKIVTAVFRRFLRFIQHRSTLNQRGWIKLNQIWSHTATPSAH